MQRGWQQLTEKEGKQVRWLLSSFKLMMMVDSYREVAVENERTGGFI